MSRATTGHRIPPPPTRFGGAPIQPASAPHQAGARGFAPPPTRFGTAPVQPSPAPAPGAARGAPPPPTRFGPAMGVAQPMTSTGGSGGGGSGGGDWQTVTVKPKGSRKTPEERRQARIEGAVDSVYNALDRAYDGYGTIYPVHKDGERKGCVKNGPSVDIDGDIFDDVWDILMGARGGSYLGCTFSPFLSSIGSGYHVTLRKNPSNKTNPGTRAILHINKN